MIKIMDDNFIISQSKTTTSTVSDFSKKFNSPIGERNRSTGASEPMSDIEFELALEHFNTKIATGRPFRDNVPRGYYLNVRV